MPAIKGEAEIAEKWSRVTPGRRTDYESGVRAPKNDWGTATTASKGAYDQGVTEAIGRDAFAKGVAAAGTAKWSRKTLELGVNRWGEGVSKSGQDFAKGFAPFRQIISNTSLPPRGSKGSPQNQERSRIMAAALHEGKLRGA